MRRNRRRPGRREVLLAAAVEEIEPSASCVAGDVREPAGAERIVRACLARHGVFAKSAAGRYSVPPWRRAKGWSAVTRLKIGGTELTNRGRARMRPGGGDTIGNLALAASPPGGDGALEGR